MAENTSNEGGLSLPGDILSLALQQTGVESLAPPTISMADSSSILSAAAATINSNLLSRDVEALTEGLLTSLTTTKATPNASSAGNVLQSPQGQWTYSQEARMHCSAPDTTFTTSCVSQSVPCNFMDLPMDSVPAVNGLATGSMGSDISDLELLDFNDLLPSIASLVPAPPVSNSNMGNSIPIPCNSGTHLSQDPFQSALPSYSTNGSALDGSLDDELSSLLNSTGTEYLESLSHNTVPQVPAPPYIPYATISPPNVDGGLLNSTVTYSSGYSAVPAPPVLSSHHYRHVPPAVGQAFNPSAPTVPTMIPRPPSMPGGREPPSRSQDGVKQEQPDEDSDDEDEQFSAADTYANYKPAKLKLGHSHPDPVVESSSLSSVEPPPVYFDLKLPANVIEERCLSSLQLEAIVYACQQHMNILADGTRAGFLVGDGAGVGKGRTVAGIIYQNYLEGRKKALWLSVSNDLKFDAIRDLRDIGAKKIKVYSLNKFHYGKISGKRNGRVRKGVIFATYSSLIGESSSGGKYRTRLNQVLHWLGSRYEGVIVLDECHKAKNLVPTGASKPSKTGLTVLQMQKKLPKARIVYCSATGASEPRNMAYMSRLGIWGAGTQFATFQDFIKAVERRGVGAMEIVAMDMKLRGMYIARQLSFSGVTFAINEVPLAEKVIEMYDASVELWVEARKLFAEAADLMDYDRKKLKTMWGQFWAAHQRFFKYLCIAAKVPETIRVAKKALEEGKCVVIGLQSTGEARTLEQLEQADGELSGFISTAKGVVESLLQRHFPTPTSGIDLSLFEGDPTLPGSCRKRRRARGGRRVGTSPRCRASSVVRGERHAPLFKDESSSDDDETSSGGPEASDSAVESSSESEDTSEDDSSDSDDDSDGEAPFGINEPWAKRDKPKAKRHKPSPISSPSTAKKKNKHRNFSIQPPPNSSSRGRGTRTKTGFNSRSLKFEPVFSPKEPPKNCLLERRQTIAVPQGISGIVGGAREGLGPHSPLTTERKPSLPTLMSSAGNGQDLLDLMSNSALTTGSQSGLRTVTVRKMKEQLLTKLALLAPHLPTNTLDELIDGLGGPDKVAEMTGRRGRVVCSNGSVQYQLRSEMDVSLELLNIEEKRRFMNGEKTIAIISEAASAGISLQADRRVKNHRRRVHITLELPWSADKAIQQFGRTHRSNQVSAPEYIFLISALSGEQRFASIVAKRLESLGALTHGDRRATESQDLSKYNFDTKYGRSALETVLKSIVGMTQPQTTSGDYPADFFDKCRTALLNVDLITRDRGLLSVEKESTNMTRFLNRILGLPVRLQNHLFAYFTDTLASTIQHAKKTGRFDTGIFDFGASGEHVEVAETQEYEGDPAFGTATTQLHRVHVERGMSFSEAVAKLNDGGVLPGEGFYVSKKVYNNKQTAVLLKASDSSSNRFIVYRPNTGRQPHSEKLSTLQKKYTKAEAGDAEKWWVMQYDSSLSVCIHGWRGRCRLSIAGQQCEKGLRRRAYHILAGSVLGVFSQLEGVFSRHGGNNSRMQIARVRMPTKRLVGILIPTVCVEDMKQTLSRVALQAAGGVVDNPITV